MSDDEAQTSSTRRPWTSMGTAPSLKAGGRGGGEGVAGGTRISWEELETAVAKRGLTGPSWRLHGVAKISMIRDQAPIGRPSKGYREGGEGCDADVPVEAGYGRENQVTLKSPDSCFWSNLVKLGRI